MARKPRATTLQQARAILDASAKLFAERGFHGTSMRDIAQEFDLNPGSLYVYISSKEQLLQSVVEFILDRLESVYDDVQTLNTDPLTSLRLIARGELAVHVEHRDWYIVYEREFRHLTDPELSRVEQGRTRLDQRLQAILLDGEANGTLRSLAPHSIASSAFLQNLHQVYETVGSTGGVSVSVFADTYTDFLLDGWRPRPLEAQ